MVDRKVHTLFGPSLTVVWSLATLATYATAKSCYMANGTQWATNSDTVPCKPSDSTSACCSLLKDDADICLDSGLCMSTIGQYSGTYWLNGCTDQDFGGSCSNICRDKDSTQANWNLMQCPQIGRWCCRTAEEAVSDSYNCCNNQDRLEIIYDIAVIGLEIPSTTSLRIPASTPLASDSSSSQTISPTTETGSTTISRKGNGSNKATVTGAAVGASLGVALLISLSALGWFVKRNRVIQKELADIKYSQVDCHNGVIRNHMEPKVTPPVEMSAEYGVSKLQSSHSVRR